MVPVSLAVTDPRLRWVLDLNLSSSSPDGIAEPANLRCPHASYSGMVAGYRETERDVL